MTLIMEKYWTDEQAIFRSFLSQFCVILWIIVCYFVKMTSAGTSEEKTVWIAFLLSAAGHFLPSPKNEQIISKKRVLSQAWTKGVLEISSHP